MAAPTDDNKKRMLLYCLQTLSNWNLWWRWELFYRFKMVFFFTLMQERIVLD